MPTNIASRPIVYLAIELSATSWVVACRRPMNEKIKLHRMEAGDGNALLALISELRRKAVAEGGVDVIVASCFEAGRDGFWLHRLLLAHGVINHVVEPTSILVTRGARRAKTDRLDAQASISPSNSARRRGLSLVGGQ